MFPLLDIRVRASSLHGFKPSQAMLLSAVDLQTTGLSDSRLAKLVKSKGLLYNSDRGVPIDVKPLAFEDGYLVDRYTVVFCRVCVTKTHLM